MATRQELIDAIEAKIAAGATVVTSVVTMVTEFVTAARNAKDDPEELEAILSSLEEQNGRLAAAVASGTQAEDEAQPEDTAGGGQQADTLGGAETEGETTISGGGGEDEV